MKLQGGSLCDCLKAKAKMEEVQYFYSVLNFFHFVGNFLIWKLNFNQINCGAERMDLFV